MVYDIWLSGFSTVSGSVEWLCMNLLSCILGSSVDQFVSPSKAIYVLFFFGVCGGRLELMEVGNRGMGLAGLWSRTLGVSFVGSFWD